MFPSQGSQQPEMSKELLKQSSTARLIFEQAEDISKISLKNLTEQEEYPTSAHNQPAASLLTHSYAVWCLLQEEMAIEPLYYAGHSLGEYTALVAAKKLSQKLLHSFAFEQKLCRKQSLKELVACLLLEQKTKNF